jgi:multidrug efflux pump subunit AcrA (membrane-fusion protein)
VWHFFLAGPEGQPGAIAVRGRIEGDDSAVAAKTSGRIREITVREGDRIEAGQVIASLDDQQIRAREQMAEAAVRQAEARVELSRHQISGPERDALLHGGGWAAVWAQVPPICAIGLVFYALAWRATRRMQVNA